MSFYSYRNLVVILSVVGISSCNELGTEPGSLEVQGAVGAAAAAAAADAVLEDLYQMSDVLPGGAEIQAQKDSQKSKDRSKDSQKSKDRSKVKTFFDGNGLEQEAFDPITTASVHVVVTIEKEKSRDNFSASIKRHRDMWVTGLEGEEETRTWNGDGSGERHRARVSDEFGERIRDVKSTSITEGVVRSVDRKAHPWPLSGTITRNIQVTITNGRNGDESRERTVVITFDGTQFATLTVNGEPSHEVDLATRKGRNPLKRKKKR
jgi:hypothetical protein